MTITPQSIATQQQSISQIVQQQRQELQQREKEAQELRKQLTPSQMQLRGGQVGGIQGLPQRSAQARATQDIRQYEKQLKDVGFEFETDVAKQIPEEALPFYKQQAATQAKEALSPYVASLQSRIKSYQERLADIEQNGISSNESDDYNEAQDELRIAQQQLNIYKGALEGPEESLIKGYYSGLTQAQADEVQQRYDYGQAKKQARKASEKAYQKLITESPWKASLEKLKQEYGSKIDFSDPKTLKLAQAQAYGEQYGGSIASDIVSGKDGTFSTTYKSALVSALGKESGESAFKSTVTDIKRQVAEQQGKFGGYWYNPTTGETLSSQLDLSSKGFQLTATPTEIRTGALLLPDVSKGGAIYGLQTSEAWKQAQVQADQRQKEFGQKLTNLPSTLPILNIPTSTGKFSFPSDIRGTMVSAIPSTTVPKSLLLGATTNAFEKKAKAFSIMPPQPQIIIPPTSFKFEPKAISTIKSEPKTMGRAVVETALIPARIATDIYSGTEKVISKGLMWATGSKESPTFEVSIKRPTSLSLIKPLGTSYSNLFKPKLTTSILGFTAAPKGFTPKENVIIATPKISSGLTAIATLPVYSYLGPYTASILGTSFGIASTKAAKDIFSMQMPEGLSPAEQKEFKLKKYGLGGLASAGALVSFSQPISQGVRWARTLITQTKKSLVSKADYKSLTKKGYDISPGSEVIVTTKGRQAINTLSEYFGGKQVFKPLYASSEGSKLYSALIPSVYSGMKPGLKRATFLLKLESGTGIKVADLSKYQDPFMVKMGIYRQLGAGQDIVGIKRRSISFGEGKTISQYKLGDVVSRQRRVYESILAPEKIPSNIKIISYETSKVPWGLKGLKPIDLSPTKLVEIAATKGPIEARSAFAELRLTPQGYKPTGRSLLKVESIGQVTAKTKPSYWLSLERTSKRGMFKTRLFEPRAIDLTPGQVKSAYSLFGRRGVKTIIPSTPLPKGVTTKISGTEVFELTPSKGTIYVSKGFKGSKYDPAFKLLDELRKRKSILDSMPKSSILNLQPTKQTIFLESLKGTSKFKSIQPIRTLKLTKTEEGLLTQATLEKRITRAAVEKAQGLVIKGDLPSNLKVSAIGVKSIPPKSPPTIDFTKKAVISSTTSQSLGLKLMKAEKGIKTVSITNKLAQTEAVPFLGFKRTTFVKLPSATLTSPKVSQVLPGKVSLTTGLVSSLSQLKQPRVITTPSLKIESIPSKLKSIKAASLKLRPLENIKVNKKELQLKIPQRQFISTTKVSNALMFVSQLPKQTYQSQQRLLYNQTQRQAILQAQTQRQAQAKMFQPIVQRISPQMRVTQKEITREIKPIPIKLKPFLPKRAAIPKVKKREEEKGYTFQVKLGRTRGGKYLTAAPVSVTKETAFALGARATLQEAAAQFRIVETGRKASPVRIRPGIREQAVFRPGKKQSTFVQKERLRIITPKEVEMISLKGAAARRGSHSSKSKSSRWF